MSSLTRNCGLKLKTTAAALLVSLIVLASLPPGISAQGTATSGEIVTRMVPLSIKVVLIGFDPRTIDQDYLTWRGNLVKDSINNVLSNGNVTGVTYDLSYEFVYSTPEFEQDLTTYLKSIQERKLIYNPWFRAVTRNTLYDAEKVEDWFVSNNASYGGLPRNGYTFVFSNLTNLPSITESQIESENPTSATPHYYRTKYVDKDLNYTIRYRDFSVAWGGRNRLWFLDLSAGPEFWTWSSPEGVPHIPMQLALSLYKVDLHSYYGTQWLTQFLADYIYDAALNLAVPVFTYQPAYSQRYTITLNIFDNRTAEEKEVVPIEETIHPELIEEAFANLLPYAEVKAETRIMSASDHPGLQKAIIENTVRPPADLAISPFVDARPVYLYLQEHLSDFVGTMKKDSTEYTLPVFAFAFSSGIYFGFTYKWYVATLKQDEGNFLGISLGDMALIGLTQNDFQRGDNVSPPQPGKGIGFTQVIIHEAGHTLGLMHPHQFGYLGDFESSAMSYWSWEYKFSQFDKDSINRAHADELVAKTLATIRDTQNTLTSKLDIGFAHNQLAFASSQLDKALGKYESMDYVGAVQAAVEAYHAAEAAFAGALSAPNGVVAAAIIALVLGMVMGASMIFLAFRKYVREVSGRR